MAVEEKIAAAHNMRGRSFLSSSSSVADDKSYTNIMGNVASLINDQVVGALDGSDGEESIQSKGKNANHFMKRNINVNEGSSLGMVTLSTPKPLAPLPPSSEIRLRVDVNKTEVGNHTRKTSKVMKNSTVVEGGVEGSGGGAVGSGSGGEVISPGVSSPGFEFEGDGGSKRSPGEQSKGLESGGSDGYDDDFDDDNEYANDDDFDLDEGEGEGDGGGVGDGSSSGHPDSARISRVADQGGEGEGDHHFDVDELSRVSYVSQLNTERSGVKVSFNAADHPIMIAQLGRTASIIEPVLPSQVNKSRMKSLASIPDDTLRLIRRNSTTTKRNSVGGGTETPK